MSTRIVNTMAEKKNYTPTFAIFLIGCFITIFANFVIIVLILRKRQLRHTRFYIIANLAVADIITLLMLASIVIRGIFQNYHIPLDIEVNIHFIVPRVIGLASRISSLLTLVFLAFDRFIAVQYSLKYQAILTKKRMLVVLVAIWLFSLTISGINWINVSIYFEYHHNLFITLTVIRVIISVLLLTLSKYTKMLRKKQINNIVTKREYFGIAKEKLDILKSLKRSLEDSCKLYIATVLVLIASTITGIVEMASSEFYHEIQLIMIMLLHVVDVIVLALSQHDIRKALKYKHKKNRVNPV